MQLYLICVQTMILIWFLICLDMELDAKMIDNIDYSSDALSDYDWYVYTLKCIYINYFSL